uniref:Cystinosin n=1 Tax=Enterobius vermicularis TaxID=51028 RepID=A0A158Q9R1_ENTVE
LIFCRRPLQSDVVLKFKKSDVFDATPHVVLFNGTAGSAVIVVTGRKIRSSAILEIQQCNSSSSPHGCPFDVVGLSFDFLLLNVIGFACYTLYNVLLFFDEEIKDIYRELHPRSPPPVLLNDVVFAAHAFAACLITALQCFFYERGKQRISYTCMGISSVFVVFAIVSLTLTVFRMIDALEFIMFLSYIKMAVTLSKYFPQAFFNFRRKSTVGWSIGNVLLDLCGGTMDIFQMILQALNTDDWSAFSGNPVKFGLGLVSIVFDFVFIIQHYVLYRNAGLQPGRSYEDIGAQSATGSSNMSDEAEYGSTVPIRKASDSESS